MGQGDIVLKIVEFESSHDPTAVNPTADPQSGSHACGLFQRLPCLVSYALGSDGKLHISLPDWPVAQQISDGIKYIRSRYTNPATGTPPENAWAHEQKFGWY